MVNKRLKILHVLPYFYPAWAYGGVPRVAFELTKELARIGHEVTVYTTDVFDRSSRICGIDYGIQVIVDGVKVVYFKNLSNRLVYDLQLFLPLGLRKKIKETLPDFDIVHLHSHRHFLNNVVRYHAKKIKKPYLLSAHGTVTQIERRFFLKTVFDIFLGGKF